MNQQVMLNMLLNQLKSKNPTGYNQVLNYMNSGKNPQEIINSMINSGQVTQEQINQVQGFLNNNNGGFKRF